MSPPAVDRRDLLKWATGLGVSFALPALDLGAASRRGQERARSLITLWLAGGPSQLETFDPHPGTKINGADGRDHWPHGFSCLLGGGDLRSGVLLGATDPAGERETPADPIPVPDLHATVLKGLGIDPSHQVDTSIGRPIRYSDGTPIDRLLSG